MPRTSRRRRLELTNVQSASAQPRRVVGVLPDVTGVDRIFSYLVPPELDARIVPGVVVRVPLGARRVRGWVVEEQAAALDLDLKPILAFVSYGATEDVVDLARFGVWRYAGRLRAFLVAAMPPRDVKELDASPRRSVSGPVARTDDGVLVLALTDVVTTALATALGDEAAAQAPVLRLPPATSRLEIAATVRALLDDRGIADTLLVLLPEHADVARLVGLLRQGGEDVASYPEEWLGARRGARIVVGTRNAVLAPLEHLGAILVVDAEAEAYVNERTPTWRADVLARERARKGRIGCVLISATPSLDVLGTIAPRVVTPLYERTGWPHLEVIDRRSDDPRAGLFAESLAEIVRQARHLEPNRSVVAVLNRTGRARLLACSACGELVACERCGAALRERAREASVEGGGASELECPRCLLSRPVICAACHSTRLKTLRIGVAKAAEEFGALIGETAVEVTAATETLPVRTGLLVGTEAVLHRVRAASLVVMLDFDQELGARRLRGAEHALGLLARAGRLVGGRAPNKSGFARRVVVQTRVPDHLVLRAALSGNPGLLEAQERETRAELALPPFSALALASGDQAAEVASELASVAAVQVAASDPGGYLIRAVDSEAMSNALAGIDLAGLQVRVEVDPEHI